MKKKVICGISVMVIIMAIILICTTNTPQPQTALAKESVEQTTDFFINLTDKEYEWQGPDYEGYNDPEEWLNVLREKRAEFEGLTDKILSSYILSDEAQQELKELEYKLTNASNFEQIDRYNNRVKEIIDQAQPIIIETQKQQSSVPQKEENPNITITNQNDFIAEWTVRIDNYLAGSPIAGYGYAFANAAYMYNVDPRWSPAIACAESGKGVVCFRPYNAWGWGTASWNSWEDAIYGHVSGLSKGYGYTISMGAAEAYCPPNASYWYSVVSAEMSRI